MTTYVNEEKQGYGKAVKATLAATLAVGMVPAAGAAFADEPAEAAEGNDVELLAVTPADAWTAALFTATDNAGKVVVDKVKSTDLKKVEFANDGKAHWVVPTAASLAAGTATEDLTDTKLYTVTYYSQADGAGSEVTKENFETTFSQKGDYSVKVTGAAETAYAGQTVTINFSVGSKSLKDATLIEGTDVADTEFVYTGSALTLGLALNGEEFASSNYGIQYYAKGSSSGSATAPTNAGDYVAVVTGKKSYAEERVEIPFTVKKLDLSKAAIELDGFDGGDMGASATVKSVNADSTTLKNYVEAKVVAVPDTIYGTGLGAYKVKVSPVEAHKANVTGEQVIEYAKTKNNNAVLKYNGKALESKYIIDYSSPDANSKFDVTKLAAYDNADALIKGAKLNVVVREKDANGKIVDASSLTKPGVWSVEVSLDPASVNYENKFKNPQTFTVIVKDGSVDAAAGVFVKYDGKVTGDKEVTYTGEDLFKNVSVVVKSGDKTLAEGTDYKVALTKEVKGQQVAVDSMVDEGTYTLTVSSDSYLDSSNQPLKDTVTFTVAAKKFDASKVFVDLAGTVKDATGNDVFPYTGKAVVPAVKYQVSADPETYEALPEGSYVVTKIQKYEGSSWTDVKEAVEPGVYKLVLDDNAEDANHTFTSSFAENNLEFTISDKKQFADVPNTEWFYGHVYDAYNAGYMSGIGNSAIFAPNDATTRAMAAAVLSRMAGVKDNQDASEPFSDVLVTDWFAKEVAWASTAGIVSGYPGTDQFRPNSNVTRAEFCIMMQRYAKLNGQNVALEAGEADKLLAGYADADAVEPWCKDAVAWAVKNKIFGGHTVLNPAGDITRAEMAKMTTAFQPEAHEAPVKPGQLDALN